MKSQIRLLFCIVLFSGMPLFAQTSANCFLEDYFDKYTGIPAYTQLPKTTSTPNVNVSINATDTIRSVSQYIYGNNANGYMTQMVDQTALIDYITRLAPNIIRFPGGNNSSLFFWDVASGTPAGAPDSLLDGSGKGYRAGYWYGKNTASWTLSVDNYYNMLDMTVSTGMITINYGFARYGTSADPVAAAAHYAANWVRYDNGRTKFWEIGNEAYGSWQAGYRIDVTKNKDGQPAVQTGALYGQHFKVFADSMRKAAAEIGSTIYLGAQVFEQSSGIDAEPAWNAGYFPAAGDAADFYIVHSYFTPYAQNSTASVVLNSGTSVPAAIKNFVTSVAAQYHVPMKPLALTEWNIFATGSKQACSFVNGMLASIVLGELAKLGYGMSSRWDLANGYDSGNDHGMFSQGDEPVTVPKWNPRPVYFYMYYFQKFFGDHVVGSTVTGNSNVLAYASSFTSGHLGIVVVNKTTATQVVSLNPANYGYGDRFYMYSLTGGTDNGEFSQSVYVNGTGPTNANGGPIGTLSTINARAYAADGGIVFDSPGRSVQYVLLEPGTRTGVEGGQVASVRDFRLGQNYPNPFNPVTSIGYGVSGVGYRDVRLAVYDLLGREVAVLVDEQKAPGDYEVTFDASGLASGVYMYRLTAGEFTLTRRMVVLR
jgi:hypothetical protein